MTFNLYLDISTQIEKTFQYFDVFIVLFLLDIFMSEILRKQSEFSFFLYKALAAIIFHLPKSLFPFFHFPFKQETFVIRKHIS